MEPKQQAGAASSKAYEFLVTVDVVVVFWCGEW
jgi:hypothetical protein